MLLAWVPQLTATKKVLLFLLLLHWLLLEPLKLILTHPPQKKQPMQQRLLRGSRPLASLEFLALAVAANLALAVAVNLALAAVPLEARPLPAFEQNSSSQKKCVAVELGAVLMVAALFLGHR